MNTSNTMEHVLGIKGIKNDGLVLEILKEKFGMNFSKKIPEPPSDYPLTYDPPIHLIVASLTAYIEERKKDESDYRLRVMDIATPEEILLADIVPPGSFLRVRLTYSDDTFKVGGKSWNGTMKEIISRIVNMTDEELEFILSEAKTIYDRSMYVSTSSKYSAFKYIDYIVYSVIHGVTKSDFIIPTCVSGEVVRYNQTDVDTAHDKDTTPEATQEPSFDKDTSPRKPVTRSKKVASDDDPQQHVSLVSEGSDESTEDADEAGDADAEDTGGDIDSEEHVSGEPGTGDIVINSIVHSGRDTSTIRNFIKSIGFHDVFTVTVIQNDPQSKRKNDPDTVVFFRRDSSKGGVLKEVARCGKKSVYQTFFRITRRFLLSQEGFDYQLENIEKYNLQNLVVDNDVNPPGVHAVLMLLLFMVIDNAVTYQYVTDKIAEDKDSGRVTVVDDKVNKRLSEIAFDDVLRFFTSSRTHEYLKIIEHRIRRDAKSFNDILLVVLDVICTVKRYDVEGIDGHVIKRGPGRPKKIQSTEPPKKKAKTSKKPRTEAVVEKPAETPIPRVVKRPLDFENAAAANALCDLSSMPDFDVETPIVINTVGGEHTVSTGLLLEILDLIAKCRKCSPTDVVKSMLEHGREDPGVVAIAGLFGFGPTDRVPFDVVLFITKLAYVNIKRDVDDLMRGQVYDLHSKIRKSFG